MAARLQHVQADSRRWRARALAVQSAAGDHAQQQQHQGLMLPPPPQSLSSSWCAAGQMSPTGQVSLQQEISLATLPKQQRQQQQPQKPQDIAHRAACKAGGDPARSEKQQADGELSCAKQQQEGSEASRSLQHLQLHSSAELGSEGLHSKAGASDEDQVLFDAELASYISDTDYTDLRSVDFEVRPPHASGFVCLRDMAMGQSEPPSCRRLVCMCSDVCCLLLVYVKKPLWQFIACLDNDVLCRMHLCPAGGQPPIG